MSGALIVSESRIPYRRNGLLLFASATGDICSGNAISYVGDTCLVAMLGVVAYFSRGKSLGAEAYNRVCAITGLGLGLVAQVVVTKWQLQLHLIALLVARMFAAIGAWAMGLITGVSNIPSYATGLLVACVTQVEASLDSYLILIAATSVGAVIAGLIDRLWPGRLALSC